MTEPERKKWRVEHREYHSVVFEEDRQIAMLGRMDCPAADAARIVALNNAEGGGASSKDQEAPTADLSPKSACSDAAGGPNSGGNAGAEPVAWQWRSKLWGASAKWARCTEEEARTADSSMEVEPLYRAPVVPEPPAEVEWRVSEERLRLLCSAAGDKYLNSEGKKTALDLADARAALAVQARERTKAEIIADVSMGYPVIDAALKRSEDERPDPTPNECPPSHVTRSSDASTYDVICINCGAHDDAPGGWGKLGEPCLKAAAPPATPVIDETRELLDKYDKNPLGSPGRDYARDVLWKGAVVGRLRSILAEHDAVREQAEGRKR